MGFMDKIKSQATSLAEAGQTKLAGIQSKKQADALLLELGGLIFEQQMGRSASPADSRIAELVSQLQAFEAEHGLVAVTPATPPPGETGSYLPGATSTAPAGVPGSVPQPVAGVPQPVAGVPQPVAGVPQPVAGVPPADDGAPEVASGGGLPSGSYHSDESTDT